METPTDNFETALDAAQKGYVGIPCFPGTKVPMVKWKRYQSVHSSRETYEKWFRGSPTNIAIICTDMVLFDVDHIAMVEVVLREYGDTPHKLWTPKGIHLGYRK